MTDLLADPNLDGLLAQEWEDYFLRALLAQLSETEQEALTRLSIFRTRLGDEEFGYAGADAAAVRRWLDLSLLQRERVQVPDLPKEMEALLHLLPEAERRKLLQAESYSVHPVVREYLLGRGTEDERRKLHLWAAAYHGRPFVEIARRYAAQSDQSWTDEEIEQVARGQVVEAAVAQTDDLAQARGAMDRALEWQHHLFQAGDYEAAGEIVTAVWEILDRWGERDRAKALLRGSIETLEGSSKAVAQGNLATLLMEEGKLDEALETYEEIYRTFEVLRASQQMAVVLSQIALIYRDQGKYERAIEYQEQSLELFREQGDKKGQAISLHRLSIFYRYKGDYATALALSEEAERLYRKLQHEAGMAWSLHQQGTILRLMAGAAQIDDEGMTHLRAAAERFRQSLAIKRRIGNEAGAADSLGELGKLWMAAGQMREAIAAFTECAEIYQRTNNPAKLGITLEFLGRIHERQGQYVAALEKYQQALGLLRQYSSPQQQAVVEDDIARLQAKLRAGERRQDTGSEDDKVGG